MSDYPDQDQPAEDRPDRPGPPPCPDCRDGKHDNCKGDTWDEAADALGVCPCHAKGHAA